MELKQTVDMKYPVDGAEGFGTNGDVIAIGVDLLVKQCHAASYNRGWWHDPITGLSLIPGHDPFGVEGATINGPIAEMVSAWFPYVIATKIALIHSEVSEGLEAYRVDATDDKIPFPGITAEMADAVIRIADLMGCLAEYQRSEFAAATGFGEPAPGQRSADYDLGAAILAKIPFNAGRPDHDLAKRAAPGGKKF